MDGLKSFFKDVKVHTGIAANSSEDLEIDCENIKSADYKKRARKRYDKTTKSNCCSKKVGSNDSFVGETAVGLAHPSFPVAKCDSLSTKTTNEVVMLKDDKGASVCHEYIDLECDSDKDSRCRSPPPTPMVGLSSNDLELTIVKETPDVDCRGPETTPRQNSHPSPNFICLEVATPKKAVTSTTNSPITEPESSWSVNSNAWKRRRILGLPSVGRLHEFNTPIEIPDRFSPLESSIITAEATYKTKEMNHFEKECHKYRTPFCFDLILLCTTETDNTILP